MSMRNGFTLLEIIAALTIVGIVAAITLPNFSGIIEQSKAQQAKNNLMAIIAAEQKYFEDNGNYCYDQGGGATCANLTGSLRLTLPANDPFAYHCSNGAPYTCTANDGVVNLTTTGTVITCTVGGSNCPS